MRLKASPDISSTGDFSAEIVLCICGCGRASERKRCYSSVGVSMCGHNVRDHVKNSVTFKLGPVNTH